MTDHKHIGFRIWLSRKVDFLKSRKKKLLFEMQTQRFLLINLENILEWKIITDWHCQQCAFSNSYP